MEVMFISGDESSQWYHYVIEMCSLRKRVTSDNNSGKDYYWSEIMASVTKIFVYNDFKSLLNQA